MMQPSNNDLDKLIREAGDQYPATGASPDWEKMQALLDKHLPTGKDPRRRGLFLLILLFLLLGGTYLYFDKNNHETSIPVKEQHASIKPANPISSQAVNPTIDRATGNKSQKRQSSLLQKKETIQKQHEIASNRSAHPQDKIAGNIKINTYVGEVGENNLPPKNDEAAALINKNENTNTTNDSTTNTSPQNKITDTVANNELTKKTAAPKVETAENKLPGNTKHIASDKKNKTNQNRKHPLELTLVYAPELTAIGFSNIDKPGSNYGLLVGYRISKNTTIQTGIVKSRKNYIANGNDFVLTYPLPANYKLNKVDGYCMMYEIPLNVKSTISKGKKINLFYTAGISSYFMKSEFYTYYYATNYGSYTKSVQYNSQKNYWLSVAALGLGIEKEITPTLNIAAMPFLKIPFKGMGVGNLKLLSTGINFTLSWKPPTGKK